MPALRGEKKMANQIIVKLLTFLADCFQHVQNRMRVTIHNASGCAHAKPFG